MLQPSSRCWTIPSCVSQDNVFTGEVGWGASVSTVWDRKLNYLRVLFFFLPLPLTYSHLSIGTATDTVWGKQTEWGGEWGWGGYSTVCSVCVSSPRLLECKRGGGLEMRGLGPLSLVGHDYRPSCIAWASISPPRFGLLCRPVSYILYIRSVWFVCSQESHRRYVLSVLQSCLQSSNIWCIYSCNSPSAETELKLMFKMHHIDLEKEAQHFKLIKPQ